MKILVEDSLVIAIADVVAAWSRWKASHDVQSLTMKCCEVSAEFFDSLEHLHLIVASEVKRLEKEGGNYGGPTKG